MGISTQLAAELVSYAPTDVTEREAWVFILKLLANKIQTPQKNLLQSGGIVSLVGPTGTGKTTTLAKLAAQFALQHGADSVAMVTIDSYRIAAYEQLATFGKIIGCSVKKAANTDELADVLYQLKDKKLVLIDTAGFSQRDSRLMSQLATLKSQNYATIKHYLVLQANTQKQALIQSIQSYADVKIEGCILTKLDETFSLGESLSVVIEQQLPVCFITDGQKVPEDIKVAESRYLVSTSAKLYQKYNDNVQQSAVSR
jgi:flagellar biosynthesis protein FlhF